MFKNVLVFVLVFGVFSGIYADQPTSRQTYIVIGIATGVGVGTSAIVAKQTDNKWAIYGSGVGGFLATCLIADLVRLAFKHPDTADKNEQLGGALKAVEHLQIGSSLDGKTTYAGLSFGL